MVTGNISLSTWYHVAYTQTGSSAILYLNGASVVSGTQPILNNVSRAVNYLGNTVWPLGPPADADFDEVKIWSRALNAAEVLSDSLYNMSYIYTL